MSETDGRKNYGLLKYGKIVILDQLTTEPGKPRFTGFKELMYSDCSTEEVLNMILPPIEFVNIKVQKCLQYVLTTPAKVSDVYELQTQLDNALQNDQARETGICPIREKIYGEFFEELIRQITINCSQRGILLMKIRNEFRSIIENYQKLYISSLAFGIRESLSGENLDAHLRSEIDETQASIAELEDEIQSLEDELINMEDNEQKFKEDCEKENEYRMKSLTDENAALREKLKDLLIFKKA